MATGPGKYDHFCTYIREQIGMTDGGVVVMVLSPQGCGFSVQADLATTLMLPDLLDDVAKQIRSDTMNVEKKGDEP